MNYHPPAPLCASPIPVLRGIVAVHSAGGQTAPPRREPPPLHAGMAPVLRFGLFSAAFERVDTSLDIETAVRIAALVSVPQLYTAGGAWPFTIEAGTVLVSADALQRTIDDVLVRLEGGALDAVALRDRYLASCAWPGWTAFAGGVPSPAHLREGLCRLFCLNQITWLACAVREPLVQRYRAFLDRALVRLASPARDRLFLDSLIMPGRSYLGRGLPPEVAGKAHARRGSALAALGQWLDGKDLDKAAVYCAALAGLTDLPERKNTDLAGCARALFGAATHRRAVTALLGLPAATASAPRSRCRPTPPS